MCLTDTIHPIIHLWWWTQVALVCAIGAWQTIVVCWLLYVERPYIHSKQLFEWLCITYTLVGLSGGEYLYRRYCQRSR
jgi:hypothetical protein